MNELRYLENVSTLRLDTEKCIGCGMCAMVCPHGVFTVEERKAQVVDLNACIECGALFGVKSTIERIAAQLEGKHSMFSASDSGKLIKMCDTCRIKAQYKSTDNPFQLGERPKTRTTDDYLKPRKDN